MALTATHIDHRPWMSPMRYGTLTLLAFGVVFTQSALVELDLIVLSYPQERHKSRDLFVIR
jgi:hypothetical protein